MNHSPASDRIRIVIAITETTPLDALWKAAARQFGDLPAEVVALFFEDDRWMRAASLPFTREFSRLGGTPADFTVQRAHQLSRGAVERARSMMQSLASKANVSLIFDVLSEADPVLVSRYVTKEGQLLLLPSALAGRADYIGLSRLACRIEIVDEGGPRRDGDEDGPRGPSGR